MPVKPHGKVTPGQILLVDSSPHRPPNASIATTTNRPVSMKCILASLFSFCLSSEILSGPPTTPIASSASDSLSDWDPNELSPNSPNLPHSPLFVLEPLVYTDDDEGESSGDDLMVPYWSDNEEEEDEMEPLPAPVVPQGPMFIIHAPVIEAEPAEQVPPVVLTNVSFGPMLLKAGVFDCQQQVLCQGTYKCTLRLPLANIIVIVNCGMNQLSRIHVRISVRPRLCIAY